MSISFERKIPKRRITIKKNTFITILNDKEGEAIGQDKRLSHKRLRREHRKNIHHSLNED